MNCCIEGANSHLSFVCLCCAPYSLLITQRLVQLPFLYQIVSSDSRAHLQLAFKIAVVFYSHCSFKSNLS